MTRIAVLMFASIAPGNQINLRHHLVVSQVREVFGHKIIMQRNKRNAIFAIEATDVLYLADAKIAISIKNHDIRFGEIARRRKPMSRLGGRLCFRFCQRLRRACNRMLKSRNKPAGLDSCKTIEAVSNLRYFLNREVVFSYSQPNRKFYVK